MAEDRIEGQCQEETARKHICYTIIYEKGDLAAKEKGKCRIIQNCLIDKQKILNSWTESTAEIFTTMRLLGTQRYLTAHRYQMKSITVFYKKMWKQQSKARKMEKSVRMDNISRSSPSKQEETPSQTSFCNKFKKTGKYSILSYNTPKKRQLVIVTELQNHHSS